jgi:hypothetical protein
MDCIALTVAPRQATLCVMTIASQHYRATLRLVTQMLGLGHVANHGAQRSILKGR